MQTLNVGAGRTDQEYEAAEEQRRTDLRADSRSDANYFFWAAGLAALGTGLLPVRLDILVSIGTVDLLRFYGESLGPLYPLAVLGAAVAGFVGVYLALPIAAVIRVIWRNLGSSRNEMSAVPTVRGQAATS